MRANKNYISGHAGFAQRQSTLIFLFVSSFLRSSIITSLDTLSYRRVSDFV
jgi:hypothetical protein